MFEIIMLIGFLGAALTPFLPEAPPRSPKGVRTKRRRHPATGKTPRHNRVQKSKTSLSACRDRWAEHVRVA